jgi:hypothetical protein
MKTLILSLLLLGGASSSQAAAIASLIQFDELGVSPVDANGVYLNGVRFLFSPGQAIFNETIGTEGAAVLSVDPVLSGPTDGTLYLVFDQPAPFLQFDILLQSIFALDDSAEGFYGGPAYTVVLSNGQTMTGATSPQPGGFYSEGEFSYAGDPFDIAAISFFNGVDAGGMSVGAFGIDNLRFSAMGETVPEPATYVALGLGLSALGLRKRFGGR